MIGTSPAFRELVALIAKVALYDAAVLIEGETGTGKELAARAIHYQGARRAKPFLPLNCGALPDTLIENELFGHCRGAYTDARSDHAGLIEAANGGTLFLDEIDSLSIKGQVTLLRFLEDHQYRPIGSPTPRRADVRIVAASNSCLNAVTREGRFRADLLYRLQIMHVRVPSLRERAEDIPLLARHFVEQSSKRFGKPVLWFTPATLDWLATYDWPGNIRELENLVCQAFLLADGPQIDIRPAKSAPAPTAPPEGWNYRLAKLRAMTDFETKFLSEAMAVARGNISEAARMMGTERRHLGRLLKKHGLDRELTLAGTALTRS